VKVETPKGVGRILTVPNFISFARLAGVPLFLYLFLVADQLIWAVVVLAIGGTSDWIDGYLARRLNQVSRLGELLDPLADRLYILATLLAFTVKAVVPLWFTAALLLREAVLLVTLLILRRHGHGPPPVHYVGKTGTFILLSAFPVLLLAWASTGTLHTLSYASGWALAWWGLGLYWLAAWFYLKQFRSVLSAGATGTVNG
jgi:cardiolipin synthase